MSTQDIRTAAEEWMKLPDQELEPQRRLLTEAFQAHAADRFFTVDIPDSIDKERYVAFVRRELGDSGVFMIPSASDPRLIIFARTYGGIEACEQMIQVEWQRRIANEMHG